MVLVVRMKLNNKRKTSEHQMADDTARSMSSSNNPGDFRENSDQQPHRWGAYSSRRPFIKRYNYDPQYYCYSDSTYGFYVPQYVPQDTMYTRESQWVNSNMPYQPYSYELSATSETESTETKISFSNFSPDAPEFIMKGTVTTTDVVENKEEKPKKKKRKKKVKTKVVETENGDKDEEKPKAVIDSTSSKSSKVLENAKIASCKQAKTVRFQEGEKLITHEDSSSRITKEIKPTATNDLVKNQEKDIWPQLKTNKNFLDPSPTVKQNATFAEKLKANSTKQDHPFLDWRDQRTNARDRSIKESTKPSEKIDEVKNSPDPKSEATKDTKFEDVEESNWTVVRKKKRDKPEEPTPIQNLNNVQQESSKVVVEDGAKKEKDKERKEKKKARAKEKKKQLREEKLLAQKLAPKGQKVTFITPQVMAKFLNANSGRNSILNKTDAKTPTFDEELFPVLGKPARPKTRLPISDSESEWETTAVEIVREKTQQTSSAHATPAPVATKNVKRSDPVQWDLMSLINNQQKPKKVSGQQKLEAKRKARSKNAGVVANPLDRNAPILVRGKIRNKKRKLSDIRKALLAAKVKRKETIASQDAATENADNLAAKRPPQPKLHSNKFREYCDQILTDDIDALARDMLFHLRHFQDRAFHKDPIKGRMRKRLVAGLREVTKQVERNRVKIIFLAPDIQRCRETGGLDQAVEHLLESARKAQLPIVYALSRRKIGRVLKKNVPVSCCGVLNHQGTEEIWNKLSELILKAKDDYQLKAQQLGLKQATAVQTIEHSKELNTEVKVPPKAGSETDALLKIMQLSLKE